MWEGGEGGGGGSTAASGGGGSARRKPSWRERENNRRRERRRRAIAAKIYSGLRAQGNYDLPKHCDNNEVLKALCAEAGYVVESDGTTYRKGCKKPAPMETGATSTNITPCSSRNPSPPSSYFASPIPSYQPTPLSSACPSPTRHDHSNPMSHPFAVLLNSLPSSLRISNSAPVTPPLAPPSQMLTLETLAKESMSALNIPFFLSSAPASPPRYPSATMPDINESTGDSGQWINFQQASYANRHNMVPTSPTFKLERPPIPRSPSNDVDKGKGIEFEFEQLAVKAWAGERSHEVAMDDLELTLGNENTRMN